MKDAEKIKDEIFFVGARDFELKDFHGIETIRGGTYNSYIILDEKITLIDTVMDSFFHEFLHKIKSITNPAKIDYIIVNHCEPDHSSSLPLILKIAPNATIICTEKAKDYLQKQYCKDGLKINFKTIKDNEEIQIGKRELKFIVTPMVHWPETMSTYLEQDKILFSCDLFGSQVCDEKLFADEIEEFNQLTKEYVAIVMKPFSMPVTNAIKKVESLNFDMIAPSHGPVWRKNPEKIINLYKKLVNELDENKILILYASTWHNTQDMALALEEGIRASGKEVLVFNINKTNHVRIMAEAMTAKGLLLGSHTLFGGYDPIYESIFPLLKLINPKGKIAGTFGSYGWVAGTTKMLNAKLVDAGYTIANEGIQVQFNLGKEDKKKCVEFGKTFAEQIK